jgi:hypothetical protein
MPPPPYAPPAGFLQTAPASPQPLGYSTYETRARRPGVLTALAVTGILIGLAS